MIWTCPNCRQSLTATGPRQLSCATGHTFDRAKQGYVNLLLEQHKKSKTPGDDDLMLHARRRFLEAGYYERLVQTLSSQIPTAAVILDLGCGEGYYLAQLLKVHPQVQGFGVDIAKTGVRLAAAKYTQNIDFAVASTYRLPIKDNSVDVALSIFSPFGDQDVARVLKSGGQVIRVGPGPCHLQEIKTELYTHAKQHEAPEQSKWFKQNQLERVTWVSSIERDVLNNDLIPMTPLQYQGSIIGKERLIALESLDVTFDFYIQFLYLP